MTSIQAATLHKGGNGGNGKTNFGFQDFAKVTLTPTKVTFKPEARPDPEPEVEPEPKPEPISTIEPAILIAIEDAVCEACFDLFDEDAAEKNWHSVAARVVEEIEQRATEIHDDAVTKARRGLSLAGAKIILTNLRGNHHSDGCQCCLCRACRAVGHAYGVAL